MNVSRRDLPPHFASRPTNYDDNVYPTEASSSSSPKPFPPMPEEEAEADTSEENIFRDMTFEEILEDLNARFLINLPREEMSLVRVYWQAEQA